MLNMFFESRERAQRDAVELQNLQTSYGTGTVRELQQRAGDASLDMRHRKHWKRLLRKARRI